MNLKGPKPTQTAKGKVAPATEKVPVRPPSSAANVGSLECPAAASSSLSPSVQEALAVTPPSLEALAAFERPEASPMRTAEILRHTVEFWYRGLDLEELPESEEEHIKAMIEDGCNQGELNYCDENDHEHCGWWKIASQCEGAASPEDSPTRTAEILRHTVEFSYWDLDLEELPESEEEQIKAMIEGGCNQGELNYCDENDHEHRGWWKIA